MKLWEIKAQALRLMFADTDINFDENDFSEEIVYNNPNTREKLVRMNDSIRRAIETFYSYVGVQRQTVMKSLKTSVVNDDTIYHNSIDITDIDYFQEPSRIDVLFFNSNDELIRTDEQADFVFHKWNNEIAFVTNQYKHLKDKVKFRVYYKLQRLNIPFNADKHDYDLDDIFIPIEVQQYIPYFVKAELFEEDEPQAANIARQLYVQFLMTVEKPTIVSSKTIKRSPIFTNRGV